MKKRLKSILGAALALCLMAGLAVPAGAYTAEVSELSSVTPSSSYVEVSSCSHYDGEHPLYIFPAGTTFQSAGYMVVQAWKIESDTGALDFYDSDYSSGSDGAVFAPEAGVIYMIQESNQMDWFQYMYIMVEGGASQQPEPTGYEVPDNSLLKASSARFRSHRSRAGIKKYTSSRAGRKPSRKTRLLNTMDVFSFGHTESAPVYPFSPGSSNKKAAPQGAAGVQSST